MVPKGSVSGKKKRKHRLGSVVEQIMRKRSMAEEGSGSSKPSTKHGSGSDTNKVGDSLFYSSVLRFLLLLRARTNFVQHCTHIFEVAKLQRRL